MNKLLSSSRPPLLCSAPHPATCPVRPHSSSATDSVLLLLLHPKELLLFCSAAKLPLLLLSFRDVVVFVIKERLRLDGNNIYLGGGIQPMSRSNAKYIAHFVYTRRPHWLCGCCAQQLTSSTLSTLSSIICGTTIERRKKIMPLFSRSLLYIGRTCPCSSFPFIHSFTRHECVLQRVVFALCLSFALPLLVLIVVPKAFDQQQQ